MMEASLLMLSEAELMRRKVNLQVYTDIAAVAPKAGIEMSGKFLSHYHFKPLYRIDHGSWNLVFTISELQAECNHRVRRHVDSPKLEK